ncbi:MAG: ATP-binding cassette domain-containing protein [Eubacteriales bacterium]|nr:ATP-binding cassette domain-containing protein [Eubacteriales bacterium]
MISIQNLTKEYGRIKALDDVSFEVGKGEILGFLGPNGAGKTTTMNIVTGYLPASSGKVSVCGFDVTEEPLEVKKRIGYLPEQPPLYGDMTVKEYLNFVAALKNVDKPKRKAQLADIMELVRISDVKDRLIKNLSKGYKQRVGLSQALIGDPEVLILDEPTVGLDPRQIIEIRKLIRALGKEHTIILSSHILPEVSAICDRIVIIDRGKVAAIDTPDNLSRNVGSSSKLSVTISGPKASVLSKIKEIYGVNNAQAVNEKQQDVVSYSIESDKEIDIRRSLFFAMAKLGYPIIEMKSVDMSLEEIFIQLVTVEREVADNVGDI